MKLEDLINRVGKEKELEIARSNVSKQEVIDKIVSFIKEQGFDVDEEYLDFVSNNSFIDVSVDVKYIPIYQVTAIAKLAWKEVSKDNKAIDHSEFVRFNTSFYHDKKNKKNRINHLKLIDVLGKDSIKLDEHIIRDYKNDIINNDDRNLPCTISPQQVLDVNLDINEFYPIDIEYLCSRSEIELEITKALEQSKSYKRLLKQNEKWSSIEKYDVKVILVPVASLYIGKHQQLVNCVNGQIDVEYEISKKITKKLVKARWISYPVIIIFVLLFLSMMVLFIVGEKKAYWPELFFKDNHWIWSQMKNFNGWIYLITSFIGLVLSLLAFPSRKGIVKRVTNNKNPLSIYKKSTELLIFLNIFILVFFLITLQYII